MTTASASTSPLARMGRALSDSVRTEILLRLVEDAAYPSELAEALNVSRQSMSNHLACLRGCGLVVATPEGRRVRYALADPRLGAALISLHQAVIVGTSEACPASDSDECC